MYIIYIYMGYKQLTKWVPHILVAPQSQEMEQNVKAAQAWRPAVPAVGPPSDVC